MCSHDNDTGLPLSFSEFVTFLQEPPFEPCTSELEFLTPTQYNNTFAEVWKRNFRSSRLYIAHLMDDREIAADLTQNVFISLYYARASFELPYIYRAAKNAAYSEMRRRNRESNALRAYWRGMRPGSTKAKELEALDMRPLQDVALIERARKEAVRRAVETLPEHFRVPLALFAAGKSYKQIIEITQVNEGTVKSRICRGKSILRRRLRAYL